MTREQKMQILREKLENLDQLSDMAVDILFGFLHEQGGDVE